MIRPHQLQALKEAADLPAIARSYAKLRRVGDHYVAKCCFHVEKTASLTIWRDRFCCFGCGARGDAIDFLIKVEGCTFQQAVGYLADFTGIGIDERKTTKKAVATAAESAAFCEWWWERRRRRIEEQKALAYKAVEPDGFGPGWDWLETVASLECRAGKLSLKEKWETFQSAATDADRAEWRADVEWERVTEAAILDLLERLYES